MVDGSGLREEASVGIYEGRRAEMLHKSGINEYRLSTGRYRFMAPKGAGGVYCRHYLDLIYI